jgi:CHAD domain-containing protein
MKDSIGDFAADHAARLSKKFNAEVRNTAKHPEEEPIHDLRVSIRRFSQCLSEFRQFLPRHKTKSTRKRLDKLMDLAAEMRNRDIAISLVGAEHSDLVASLGKEREQAKRKLIRALHRWRRHDST